MTAPLHRPHGSQQQPPTEPVPHHRPPRQAWPAFLRRAAIVTAFLLLLFSGSLTQLAQPGSFLLTIATAHAASATTPPPNGKNTYQPVQDKGGAAHRPANQVKIASPSAASKPAQPITHNTGHLTPPFDVTLDPLSATTTTSPDGQLQVTVPARALTATMVAQLGAVPHLRITQLQGPSGGSTGGHMLFGSFLVTLVGPHGPVSGASGVSGGLARPITVTLRLPSSFHGAGAMMSQVQLAVMPTDANGKPLKPANSSPAAQAAVAAVATNATYDPTANTLTSILTTNTSTGGTSFTWDTSAPDAHWSAQADASVDLPSGNLTYNYPLDVPPGPGGLTPKLAFTYDSGSVDDNHNPQATAGWMGEGWSLTGGSISWGEHNVSSMCTSHTQCPATSPNCSPTNPTECQMWEDSWQFSDPYGNGGDLIPSDSNLSPWYDDATYGGATTMTSPIAWHVNNEAGVKIFSYTNPIANPYFPSQYYPVQPPCFRAFLPNGFMEEFGCTADSLQWYVNTNTANNNSLLYYIYRWDLDMVADPSGNQIHYTYKQAMNGLGGVGGNFPIDAVLSAISYDSPTCHSTTTRCSGASWMPAVQILFTSDPDPWHLRGAACPHYTDTTTYINAQTMRCDDPQDLGPSGGEHAPALQSLYTLNNIRVQLTTTPSSPTWNTLRNYQFAYEMGAPTTIYDPVIGWRESVAGHLLLDSFQEVGDDNTTTLPALNMTYTSYTENYLDLVLYSKKTDFCGPSWNTTSCHLWSKTWNTRYLSEIDNGEGWKENFTYAEAHNNSHGVNSGLNLLDPLACNGQQSNTNACGKSDDQNWSRIVLTKRVGEVQCVTLQGGACAGSNNGLAHDSTWTYTYTLTDVTNLAKRCTGCNQTMYWGDANDGDSVDFYNSRFMGFKNVNVTSPDNSLQVYTYYTTKGYGIATSAIQQYCDAPVCDISPWTDPLNALHGRVQEEDDYDTNATTLLKQTMTTYAVTCPPDGISASAHNASNSQIYYVGQNTSELDPNNPITVCRIDTSQVDTYQVDGGAPLSGTHTTDAYTYTYDSRYTYLYSKKEDQSSNDTGSTYHIITTTSYVWHDALTVTSTGASGVYFDMLPGREVTQRYSGGFRACTYYGYDGGAVGLTNGQAGVVRGLLTTSTRYSTDCDPGSESGPVSIQATYNANGDLLATKDADALAGVTGHTDATDCTINSVAYSACANYDSLYSTQVTRVFNALHRQTNLSYITDGANTNSPDATNGWGQWLTTSADPNLRVSAYGYDPLGRVTTMALPGDTLSSPTTSFQYAITCPVTGASTPCAALVKTQRLNSSTTTTSATYYDGWGHPVETVTPAFDAPDGAQTKVTYSVTYTMYDPSGRVNFVSDPYFVSQDWSGAIGTPPYFPPDNTVAGTTTRYDGLGRVYVAFDPLGRATSTSYSEQQPQGANVTDTGVYAATTVTDANSHKTTTLTDGLGRVRYTEQFNAVGALARTTLTTDDPLDAVKTVYGPATSGPAGLSTTPQTTITYDLTGRVIGMDDADLGNGWSYGYDPNSNQTSIIDPRGAAGGGAVYAGYDGLNRQLWRNTTNSPTGAYVTYTYDQTTAHGYGIGHLTSESFTGGGASQPLHGAYSYYYGARGELTNFTLTTTENANYTLAYGYNDAGQPTSLTYSDGEVFTTQYNNEDWLSGAATTPSGGSQVNLLSNVAYSGVGGAAGHVTNANLGNGTYALSASYDNDLRFTNLNITNVSLGTTLFGTARAYDNVGNVIAVNTTLATGTDNQAFCYDSVNRLYWAGSTGAPSCGWSLTPGSLTAANYTASYTYDASNRLTTGSLGTLTYGDSAHIHGATGSTSGETAAYDAAGDMTCRAPTSATTCAGTTPTGAQLTYDAERRLTSWQSGQDAPSGQTWFMYDGSGQRVEQYVVTGSGDHTYYLPGNVEEVTPTGSLIKYYSAGGMALGVNTAHDASGISYLASDGLGSVSEALSPSGTATGAQLYSPYGGIRYTTGVMPTSKGFTGQYADASTGLDYYGARYYDPSLGQFTSADTVTDGVNRYGYVKGNPTTFTDPTGHRIDCQTGDCGGRPPSSGGGGGGGSCHSDATCGCYANCGGSNSGDGGGGHCGGAIDCSPSPSAATTPPCQRVDHVCASDDPANGHYLFAQLGPRWAHDIITGYGIAGIDQLISFLNKLKDIVTDEQNYEQLVDGAWGLAAGTAIGQIIGGAIGTVAMVASVRHHFGEILDSINAAVDALQHEENLIKAYDKKGDHQYDNTQVQISSDIKSIPDFDLGETGIGNFKGSYWTPVTYYMPSIPESPV